MAKWDMTKKNINSDGKVISTGQTVTPLFDDSSSLESRVSDIEDKLDLQLNTMDLYIRVKRRAKWQNMH